MVIRLNDFLDVVHQRWSGDLNGMNSRSIILMTVSIALSIFTHTGDCAIEWVLMMEGKLVQDEKELD
jgi:hypothetical protein